MELGLCDLRDGHLKASILGWGYARAIQEDPEGAAAEDPWAFLQWFVDAAETDDQCESQEETNSRWAYGEHHFPQTLVEILPRIW